MKYLSESLRDFQYMVRKEDKPIDKFGWDTDNTCFTIGNKAIYGDREEESVSSMGLEHIADSMLTKGVLSDWVSIANMFKGERLAPHAFVLFSGLGMPLLKLSGMDGSAGVSGYTIALYSKESGTGKSSALQLVNSIYGHPTELMMPNKDTTLSRTQHLNNLQNIPGCLDDVFKMPSSEKKELIYAISNTQSKKIKTPTSIKDRLISSQWNTGLFVSTSDSILNDLGYSGKNYDTPAKRIIEFACYPIRSQDPLSDKRILNLIKYNYGLAGKVFIKALLGNKSRFIDVVLQEEVRVEQELGLGIDERHWIAAAAIGLAGGRLAYELKLHNLDVELVRSVVYDTIKKQKNQLDNIISEDNTGVLNDFVIANIDKLVREKEDGSIDIASPKKDLVGRICQQDGTLEASRVAFRQFCVSKKMSTDDILERLNKSGTLISDDKKPSFARGAKGPYERIRARSYIFKIDAKGIERTINNSLVAS